jgi:hypothetical protein
MENVLQTKRKKKTNSISKGMTWTSASCLGNTNSPRPFQTILHILTTEFVARHNELYETVRKFQLSGIISVLNSCPLAGLYGPQRHGPCVRNSHRNNAFSEACPPVLGTRNRVWKSCFHISFGKRKAVISLQDSQP